MPLTITKTAAEALGYGNPFVSPIEVVDHIKVDVSALTVDEVDAFGYLKPGVPFSKAGLLLATGVPAYGVTVEAIKIVPINPTNTTLAAITNDPFVGVCLAGLVNRDIVEDNLGRALTTAEVAGFDLAGSTLHLTRT